MTTSLVPTTAQDIMTHAKAFAESGMFQDTRQAAQAFVKIQAGAELGIAPFAAMSGIHIISGKPVLGAGLLAGLVKRSGKYDYRVIEQSAEVCSIDFFQGKELIGNSTFTISEARKAGVKNLDKFAANMLFARAISNGAKWYTPDVVGGVVYTEGDFDMSPPVQDTTAVVVDDRAPAPRMSKKAGADYMKAMDAPELPLTDAETKFIFDELDRLEKAAQEAATPEQFQAIGKELATGPSFVRVPAEEKKKAFLVICEYAMEKGIDYVRPNFVVRETGETSNVEVVEAEAVS